MRPASHRSRFARSGSKLQSDVAELFTVEYGRIATLGIYFDTARYPG